MNKDYSVVIDGETVTFEFKDSLIHNEGEHAGNIDAIITTKPPLPQNQLLDELHIKIPGYDELLYIYGYGVVENSLKATFNSSSIINMDNLPETVEVYWGAEGDLLIGEMCCQQFTEEAESELSEEIETNEEEVEDVDSHDNENTPVNEVKDQAGDTESNDSNINKTAIIVVIAILILIAIVFSI